MLKRIKLIFISILTVFLLFIPTGISSAEPSVMTVTDFSAEYNLTLPLVCIESDEIRSKDEYIPAKITVSDPQNDIYTGGSAKIRGRGNTTWTQFPKKPYRVKLGKKSDVLGMGAARDWLLLADYRDATLLRNSIALHLGQELGLAETPEFCHVNLIINGKYRGMYLLCERVEDGDSRVLLRSGADGESSGFLLEVDNAGDVGDKRYFVLDTVEYGGRDVGFDGVPVIIHYPKNAGCTDGKVCYIKSYVYALNKAILTRDWESICEYLDVESAVDYFIVSEMMLSADMGWSFYLHKNAGEKLRFGPLWDYDQSCGNSTQYSASYEGWNTGHENYWLTSLIEIDEFKELVRRRWSEVRPIIEGIPDYIISESEKMKPDIDLNFTKWNNVLGKKLWRIPDGLAEIDTYEGNVRYLIDWWNSRFAWMDGQLG